MRYDAGMKRTPAIFSILVFSALSFSALTAQRERFVSRVPRERLEGTLGNHFWAGQVFVGYGAHRQAGVGRSDKIENGEACCFILGAPQVEPYNFHPHPLQSLIHLNLPVDSSGMANRTGGGPHKSRRPEARNDFL